MAEHTDGPWEAIGNLVRSSMRPPPGILTGVLIAECLDVYQLPHTEEAKANARRIVACVNACEGISTENLEDNQPVKWLAQQHNEVVKQRDELLDALKNCEHVMSLDLNGLTVIQPELKAARAAIAKAAGEQK